MMEVLWSYTLGIDVHAPDLCQGESRLGTSGGIKGGGGMRGYPPPPPRSVALLSTCPLMVPPLLGTPYILETNVRLSFKRKQSIHIESQYVQGLSLINTHIYIHFPACYPLHVSIPVTIQVCSLYQGEGVLKIWSVQKVFKLKRGWCKKFKSPKKRGGSKSNDKGRKTCGWPLFGPVSGEIRLSACKTTAKKQVHSF